MTENDLPGAMAEMSMIAIPRNDDKLEREPEVPELRYATLGTSRIANQRQQCG